MAHRGLDLLALVVAGRMVGAGRLGHGVEATAQRGGPFGEQRNASTRLDDARRGEEGPREVVRSKPGRIAADAGDDDVRGRVDRDAPLGVE